MVMFQAADSPYLVPYDDSFRVQQAPCEPGEDKRQKKRARAELAAIVKQMREHQRRLYASDRWSILLVFQAMDAAGKDGTIRAVLGGINPAGCQVFSFKQPSKRELDHDFLWRSARRLPERGRIGVFNRSYYEELLVVRVHPEYLNGQQLPSPPAADELDAFWSTRLRAIRDHERHLAESGTVVLKFWLNVSKEEQRKRFLARLDEPDKNWKFSAGDIVERGHWDKYMHAYECCLRETSRPWAPWYVIPADHKPSMRVLVAEHVLAAMEQLDLRYPGVHASERAKFAEMRKLLEGEKG